MEAERLSVKKVYRSMALILVFMHTFLYHYKNFSAELFYPEMEKQPSRGMQILFYFMLMGGAFVCLSGLKTLVNISRIKTGNDSIEMICVGDIILGFQFIVVDRIFAFFFCPVNGIVYKKLMKQEIGSMYELKLNLYLVDSLFAMGSCMIFSSIAQYVFLKNHTKANLFRRLDYLQVFFLVIATSVMILTPTVRKWGFVRVNELIESKRYITAMFVNFLCGDYYPLFPYIAHFSYTAFAGVVFAQSVKRRKPIMYIFLGIGIFLFFFGFYLISTHWRLGVYIGIYFEFSTRGMDYRTFLQYSQFGLMCILFTMTVLLTSDINGGKKGGSHQKKRKKKKYDKTKAKTGGFSVISFLELNYVGKISLTIFVFESVLKAAIHLLLNDYLIPNFFPLMEGWDYNLGCVVVFGFFNVFLWIAIIKVWKRFGFVMSLDWVLVKVVELMTGKKSTKFQN